MEKRQKNNLKCYMVYWTQFLQILINVLNLFSLTSFLWSMEVEHWFEMGLMIHNIVSVKYQYVSRITVFKWRKDYKVLDEKPLKKPLVLQALPFSFQDR